MWMLLGAVTLGPVLVLVYLFFAWEMWRLPK
jgi:hypothetical protein